MQPEQTTSLTDDEAALADELVKDLDRELPLPRLAREAPPPTLFHYTTPGGLKGILESGTLWLTEAGFLNDAGELTYPLDRAKEWLVNAWGKRVMAKDESEAEFLTAVIRELERIFGRTNGLEELMTGPSGRERWFVGCLTTKGNLLSQWRGYCPSGGFALGFIPEELVRALPADFGLAPVVYSQAEQDKRIEKVIDTGRQVWRRLSTRYAALAIRSPFERSLYNQFTAASLARQLSLEFVYFKSPAFGEEDEWRIVSPSPITASLKFRSSHGVLIPYVEAPIAHQDQRVALKQIFHSPDIDHEVACTSLELYLESRGYDTPRRLVGTPGYRLRPR